MTLGHVAVIEVVALIAVLGWAAWFFWRMRRRDAAAAVPLAPYSFVKEWQKAGEQFGLQLADGIGMVVVKTLADREECVLTLMALTGADQDVGADIIDTASRLSFERLEDPQALWAEVLDAAAMGRFK